MFSKILFTLEVVALIAAPVGYLKLRDYRAEQFFEEGDAALQAGDWDRAYTCYQESARRENKELVKDVACRLTLCKDFGLGVAPAAQLQNCPWHDRMFSHCLAVCKVPAKQIFEGAKQGLAESGSTDLIVWVAAAYMNGYSTVSQPYEEATDWYRMAAVRGRVDAQRQLVTMAYERKWTPGSGELPSEWLLNVKDMLEARILLGERVAAGEEALVEHSEGDDWLLVATQYGNRAATERVIEKVLAGTYSSEKKEEALRLLLIAAHDGNVAAQVCIGLKLAEGEDFPLSQESATNYILAAARQGNEKAQVRIVELAQQGTYRDSRWDSLPTEWILLAAKQGNEKAQVRVVELIQFGLYTDATWDELPIAWLIAAAQNNNEAAQAYLGAKLAEGATLDLPEETSINCLFAVAKQGNEKAQVALGKKLAEGVSLPIPQEASIAYLLVAAKQGDVLAQGRIVKKVLGRKCTPELEQEAIPFLLSEAKNGNSAVQAYLGAKLADGATLDLPEETVANYLISAAKQGNGKAQAYLGIKLLEGRKLPISRETATYYLSAAAKQGNKGAKAVLEQAFKEEAWDKRTLEERFRALRPYAEAGIADAQRRLADCYWGGWGIPQSRTMALKWYKEAAANGDPVAQRMVENYDIWEEGER